jgi:hypothetical protein
MVWLRSSPKSPSLRNQDSSRVRFSFAQKATQYALSIVKGSGSSCDLKGLSSRACGRMKIRSGHRFTDAQEATHPGGHGFSRAESIAE